jgi:hypothetical protein
LNGTALDLQIEANGTGLTVKAANRVVVCKSGKGKGTLSQTAGQPGGGTIESLTLEGCELEVWKGANAGEVFQKCAVTEWIASDQSELAYEPGTTNVAYVLSPQVLGFSVINAEVKGVGGNCETKGSEKQENITYKLTGSLVGECKTQNTENQTVKATFTTFGAEQEQVLHSFEQGGVEFPDFLEYGAAEASFDGTFTLFFPCLHRFGCFE